MIRGLGLQKNKVKLYVVEIPDYCAINWKISNTIVIGPWLANLYNQTCFIIFISGYFLGARPAALAHKISY